MTLLSSSLDFFHVLDHGDERMCPELTTGLEVPRVAQVCSIHEEAEE